MISVILDKGIELPKYETELASGLDVKAMKVLAIYTAKNVKFTDETFKSEQDFFEEEGYIDIGPFERVLIGTGITIADMPRNAEIQVRPRSGVSLKRGLFVANSPGTIDADYRGEIGIIIYNSSPFYNRIEKGERIAQIVTSYVDRIEFGTTTEIIPTERGNKGYNSTGTK